MRKKENNAFVQHNAMQFKTIADNAGHGTTVTVKTETVSELVFVYIRVLVWVLTNKFKNKFTGRVRGFYFVGYSLYSISSL